MKERMIYVTVKALLPAVLGALGALLLIVFPEGHQAFCAGIV